MPKNGNFLKNYSKIGCSHFISNCHRNNNPDSIVIPGVGTEHAYHSSTNL